MKITFARVRVTFEGSDSAATAIREEIARMPQSEDDDIHLSFSVCKMALSNPESIKILGSKGRTFELALVSESGRLNVRCAGRLSRKYELVPSGIFRLLHPGHLSQSEYLAQLFFRQVFYPLVQMVNLRHGQTFVHALAIERGARRIAVIADGGMGKTGTLLRLVVDAGWRYLSDDWTVVESCGRIHRSQKSLAIFPRNLRRHIQGEARLWRSLSCASRTAWKVRKSMGVERGLQRAVQAEDLFEASQIGTGGPLTEAFLIQRSDVTGPMEISMNPSQLGEAAARMVERELAASRNAMLQSPILAPELAEMPRRTAKVFESAFSGVVTRCFLVPEKMPEPMIEDYLFEHFESGRE